MLLQRASFHLAIRAKIVLLDLVSDDGAALSLGA